MKDMMIGVDLAKTVFQLHGALQTGEVQFRKKLTRKQFVSFMANLEPCLVIFEACGGAHFWAREMEALGHESKLIAPQYVRPFVKRQKNDAADAEAIVIAARQPEMRFVAVKTAEQQSRAAVFRGRERLVHQRTEDVNALRALLYEHGYVFPVGIRSPGRMASLLEDETADLPALIRDECKELLAQIAEKTARVLERNKKLSTLASQSDRARRLQTMPGVGPITAIAVEAFGPDMAEFKTGRNFAAWLGLVPRQHSSGGKERLGRMTKAGQADIRRLLIIGAMSRLNWLGVTSNTTNTVALPRQSRREGSPDAGLERIERGSSGSGLTRTMTMAKTTTRSKPSSTKKTEATGPTAPDGAADIRMIPLDQLEPSPLNVRKVAASASDDAELLASIRETGIKQNLVVHALSETRFAVDAGGRRLKALKRLAEDGVIPADHPVPCLIEDERNAILTSTTENLQRAAMHPADQFEAFEAMIVEGRSEDEIALKFGVSVDLVRRRLKLARVAPEIIEQFRAGDLTLECVMAFTLTDDHDRQLAVWNAVKGGYHIHPQSIKRQLTETAHSAKSALGRFVGIEAYEAAGGVLLRDLFDDRASAHMENPELLERLAIEKLQTAAKTFEGTWKWVEVHLSVDYGAFRSFGRVYPQDIDPDPDLLAEEERLIAREEELAAQNDGEDWTDAETEEYYAIEPRLREIEAQQRERQPYTDEDRAIAGVVLTIGHDGELRVEKGLVRPGDIPVAPEPDDTVADADGVSVSARPHVTPPTSSTPVPTSDPAATLRKADGISASLADDLRATRQHILRAHLAADFEVAFDAMLYALCEQALGRSCNNEALDISIRSFQAQNREVLHADTVAQKMLKALEQDLATDWMKLEKPDDFRAMSALPIADKQALFAWATGLAVKPQLSSDNRPSPIIEEIGARLDVDVAACWRPTAQNYWGRVNKGHAVATARKLIGDDYAEDRNRERKGDIAAAMERAFADTAGETEGFDAATVARTTRWLPEGMVFAGATEAFADMGKNAPEAEEGAVPAADPLTDAESDEPSSLPAFLSGDAA